MHTARLTLLTAVTVAGMVGTCLAATGPAGGPVPSTSLQAADNCMAPAAFLTTLATAGDWVIGRAPKGAETGKLTGVVFRESGMIDVALFEEGCLAAVVIVGRAPPDIVV